MRRSSRPQRGARAATALTSATVVLGFVLPAPYVVTQPGPVFDVLGESDGEPVVAIKGAPTFPTTGRLDLVTVSQLGGTSSLALGGAIAGWLLPDRTVEPKRLRYPPGSEPEREAEIDAAVFQASASSALAATATYLGRPVASKVLVSQVEPGSPADGLLESGDVITSVAGQPTDRSSQVIELVSGLQAGAVVEVDYLRGGAAGSVGITSAARPNGEPGAYLGVLLVNSYTSDFTADVSLEGIGGPSAGLVFSLAMVDEMTAGDLLRQGHAAATGTIDADGRVGPIGGAEKKMVSVRRAGAELFLVPPENCADVAGREPEGLIVAPAGTLASAVELVTAWRAGEDVPTCS